MEELERGCGAAAMVGDGVKLALLVTSAPTWIINIAMVATTHEASEPTAVANGLRTAGA